MANVLPAGAASQQIATLSAPAHASGGGLFHELLSDLNPLQYIPVIGTIYRAITGDQGNPTLRFVASLGTSFALGGPIGIAITAGEKLAGIDPEQAVLNVARHLFHLGHDDPAAEAPAALANLAAPAAAPEPALAFAVNSRNLSADDLNGMELQRLHA